MTSRILETVLREAAARAADLDGESLPDADLLRRYCELRDENAFNALVSRHGRIVWAVCRQSLPCEADAEDAFQATFLALSRNAKSVRSHLPAWLHSVAVKICSKVRRTAGRRLTRDAKVAVKEASQPVAESAWDGLLVAVHAEVSQLPATLRDVFILVDLQGITQTEAAKRLGWKAGTLTGRLSQARQTLINRLSARGLTPTIALTGCGIGMVTTHANVPLKLYSAACAVGKLNAIVPTVVNSLAAAATEGTMMLKTKLLAAGILLATATAMTVVAAQTPMPSERSAGQETRKPTVMPKAEQPKTGDGRQVLLSAMMLEAPVNFAEEFGLGEGDYWILTAREMRILNAAIRRDKSSSIDVLSRPQLSLIENQSGTFNVGSADNSFSMEIKPTLNKNVSVNLVLKTAIGKTKKVSQDGQDSKSDSVKFFDTLKSETAASIPLGSTLITRSIIRRAENGELRETYLVMTPKLIP